MPLLTQTQSIARKFSQNIGDDDTTPRISSNDSGDDLLAKLRFWSAGPLDPTKFEVADGDDVLALTDTLNKLLHRLSQQPVEGKATYNTRP